MSTNLAQLPLHALSARVKSHRTPGGSSSGSGVAVAARMVPCAMGTDTGPMTRSVEDAALLLAVMQGADLYDPRTLALRDADPVPTLCRGVKGLRLARMA